MATWRTVARRGDRGLGHDRQARAGRDEVADQADALDLDRHAQRQVLGRAPRHRPRPAAGCPPAGGSDRAARAPPAAPARARRDPDRPVAIRRAPRRAGARRQAACPSRARSRPRTRARARRPRPRDAPTRLRSAAATRPARRAAISATSGGTSHGLTVPTTPRVACPVSRPCSIDRSVRSASSSLRIARARSSTFTPNSVGTAPRRSRTSSCTPSSASSWRTCSDTLDCTVWRRSAAAVKDPSSATASRASSWRMSTESSGAVPAQCPDPAAGDAGRIGHIGMQIYAIASTPLTDRLVILFTRQVSVERGGRFPPPAPRSDHSPQRSGCHGRRDGLQLGLHRSTDVDRRGACHGQSRLFFAPPGERPEARAVREAQARAVCRSCAVLRRTAATGRVSTASTGSGVASPKKSAPPPASASTCPSAGSPGTPAATASPSPLATPETHASRRHVMSCRVTDTPQGVDLERLAALVRRARRRRERRAAHGRR